VGTTFPGIGTSNQSVAAPDVNQYGLLLNYNWLGKTNMELTK